MKRILTFAFLLLNFYSFGQENFKPGYIVTSDSDTIVGTIDFRDWAVNPEQIMFAEKAGDAAIPFFPEDIKSFGVADTHYLSAMVDIGTDSHYTAELDTAYNLNTTRRSVFLKMIVKGDKSLYYYNGGTSSVNFYIHVADKLELLEYKKYVSESYGDRNIKINKKYLGQLRFYLGDCEDIASYLRNVRYDKNSLTRLFGKYYSCVKADWSYSKKREKTTFKWGVFTGMTATDLSFTSSRESFSYLVDAGFETDYHPTVGVNLEAIFPLHQRKWSLFNELMYSAYSFTDHQVNFENETGHSKTDIAIGFSYLKLNSLIRYTYPLSGIKVFGNIGISNGFALSMTNSEIQENLQKYNGDDHYSYREYELLNGPRKYEQAFLLGLGLKVKDTMMVEFRHERGNGMSSYIALGSSVTRNSLLISYQF
ncbi:hypothetical protein GCM10028791_35630 [Echinicola sediminis]